MASSRATVAVTIRNPTTEAMVLLRVVYGAERLTSRYQVGWTPTGSWTLKISV